MFFTTSLWSQLYKTMHVWIHANVNNSYLWQARGGCFSLFLFVFATFPPMDRCPFCYQGTKLTLFKRVLRSPAHIRVPNVAHVRCGSKKRGGFGWKGTDEDGLLSAFPPVRESELRELRKTLERAQVEQEALQRQLLELQVRCSGGRQPVPISAACCSAQGLAWWARKLERKTTWSN